MVGRLGGKMAQEETGQVGERVRWVMKGLVCHFKEVQLSVPYISFLTHTEKMSLASTSDLFFKKIFTFMRISKKSGKWKNQFFSGLRSRQQRTWSSHSHVHIFLFPRPVAIYSFTH